MLLADYTSENHCFEFDPDTGVYSHIKLPAPPTDRIGYSGMAQLLRSIGEGKVLVAQYLLSGDAWFSIGAEKWKLFDESMTVQHRETWGIFLCELSLHKDGKCVKKFRYVRRDWFIVIIDPAYDNLDFSLANLPVDLEPHDLSSLQKQREDFIKLWSGHSVPNKALNPDAPTDGAPVSCDVRPYMTTLNVRKLANAFFLNATPSGLVPAYALSAIRRFKRTQGGLWVGGTVEISQAGVSFSPNGLNRVFHEPLEPISVPAKDVRAVRYEFGWVTGIVVVEHVHGEFRFRCYGAKHLAATMATAFNAS